jgi:hypothetical protein
MSKLNLLLSLNAYEDSSPSNHPSKSVVKWVSDLQGIEISEPNSQVVNLQPGQTLSLFSGAISTLADNTTSYDVALRAGSTTLYDLKHNDGTAPGFRTARSLGGAADTEVTVTKNGTTLTFTQTGGTAWALTGVQVGDEVRIQNIFNILNRGKSKVIASTSTSFTIENASGQAEGPIVLGAGFANDVQIYSATGVQIGNKVKIDSGFSSVSFGTYDILDVGVDFISFSSTKALPAQTDVISNIQIFDNFKKFLFIESNKKISLTIDGTANGTVDPFQVGVNKRPGIYMRNSAMYSASIKNESAEVASVSFVTAE